MLYVQTLMKRQRAKSEPAAYPTKGGCICGAVTVELLSPLQDMAVKEDNCSICTRVS